MNTYRVLTDQQFLAVNLKMPLDGFKNFVHLAEA